VSPARRRYMEVHRMKKPMTIQWFVPLNLLVESRT
jgi:hypothetical protein